jgi:hypothetical protein
MLYLEAFVAEFNMRKMEALNDSVAVVNEMRKEALN